MLATLTANEQVNVECGRADLLTCGEWLVVAKSALLKRYHTH